MTWRSMNHKVTKFRGLNSMPQYGWAINNSGAFILRPRAYELAPGYDRTTLPVNYSLPCKHAISCQYRACTGPMLPASAQYWQIMACVWGMV